MKPAIPTPHELSAILLSLGWTQRGEDGDGNWRTYFFQRGSYRASLDEPAIPTPFNLARAYAMNARRFQIALANSL